MHALRKLRSTIRIIATLAMARTFGKYVHSTGGHGFPDCAVYQWRGKVWSIPTGPVVE